MAMGDAQAVICATGFSGWNVTQVGSVDEEGTKALVDAAKVRCGARVCVAQLHTAIALGKRCCNVLLLQSLGMKKFILVSSLLTNAKAVGQENNANYKFLNLFGGVREPCVCPCAGTRLHVLACQDCAPLFLGRRRSWTTSWLRSDTCARPA